MNSHLFERKSFLDNKWINTAFDNQFSQYDHSGYKIIKLNILRATADESEAFKKYISKLLNEKTDKIIFDMSETTFIDSTFLSNLIALNKRKDCKIKLIVSDKRQLAIFRITKIDSLFQVYTTLDQALIS